MATFKPAPFNAPVVPNGSYVGKIISAFDRVSSDSHEMITMKIELAGSGAVLPSVLTFVEKAWLVITAFCKSADLTIPDGDSLAVDLTAADCLGRYIYVSVVNEDDGQGGDPYPKIVRFMTREAALIKNPQLAKIVLRKQEPRVLKAAR